MGYFDEQNEWLVNEFSRCNVIVFGPKGSGKDLVFAHVLHLRSCLHYSNMPYNKHSRPVKLRLLSAGGNTYKDIMNGTVKKYVSPFKPGTDIYISDGGICLPSDEHIELQDMFPSLPLFFALSRQLEQHNIHLNTQALGRLWIKLREQADSYIRVLSSEVYDKFILTHCISYDNYRSADAGFLPTISVDGEAQRGKIEWRTFLIYKNELKYDTYYFANVFLKSKSYFDGLSFGTVQKLVTQNQKGGEFDCVMKK